MTLPPNYLFVNPKDGRLVSKAYLQLPGGTSTAPGLSFIDSADSGVSCASNGDIGIVSNGVQHLTVSSTGTVFTENVDLASGKVYEVNGTQVVGARVTGWAAATGTATRTTFVTSTVTLEQLAERVKALVDDLIAHGLIGT
jgi:hypothetical protein